ncbi:MAG TPA: glycosyltransferase family 2 protein [Chthoniobacterales bacterium]|jgi:succinoglycan biosynthesis protein ExoM
MPAQINVCVATYKRPALLRKLLESLLAQETSGEFTFDIIVADNDAQRSAEPVVGELNATGRKIIYVVEPRQNISLARNKALSHATGDYIATIDDDEHADPRWLLNLYQTIVAHGADVVFGPVLPSFHPDTPDWIRNSHAFRLPDPPTGSTGNYVPTTANSLFRRALIQHTAVPFDPAFGRTGGGDTAFFEIVRKQGHRHVWCREASVFEFISPERTNWRWILQREFCRGNIYHRVYDQGHLNPRLPRAAKVLVLGKRAVERCVSVPFYFVRGLFDGRYTVRAVDCLRSCAFHVGMIAHFLGFQYIAYRGR